ncbi:50S ribosomal protein L16 [Candidatus Roizmanbacteria bacterium RIFCSPHIGHO2_02_FULL_40_9]|uniref:50S ribosomal protein L16 n=2 Tax=Candidatus Roizmaniibacteriota TaxID=1752723 RepID=A0A1F7IL00_9BACT|nr:MAG: 50S ribosomal protein L16 [Candidatus Roizmanbacteria bacterium RIFCSPHIGHO2_02_FULL_40_9]OGK44013.1 MAG: 50S ribosomal protein L16 [Candidatus Roizmanbacteria bacterium RIFCSPLOWO2_01_FULL_38_11]
MLSPKRLKYRRQFRGRWRSIAIKGDKLNFGTHAVKATESAWVTDRQIEACRVVLARSTRKAGRFWIRIFPDRPYTKKPPEVTMGAGKGDVSHYVAAVAPGRVLFEMEGLDNELMKSLYKNLSSKLSVRTKLFIKNV